mgnify:CR=1 FL=1
MSIRIVLGAVLGGPEIRESAVYTAMHKISDMADKLGSINDDSVTGINYVLHIAGSIFKPDYEGVRDARFSKKRKLLMIQMAVPEKLVSSDTVGPFLCEMMRQGVVEATPIFEKAKLPFDPDKFSEFIDDIERELGWRK